jgi:hypothetical protein
MIDEALAIPSSFGARPENATYIPVRHCEFGRAERPRGQKRGIPPIPDRKHRHGTPIRWVQGLVRRQFAPLPSHGWRHL